LKTVAEAAAGLDQGVHDAVNVQRVLRLERLPTTLDAMRYHFCKKLAFDPGSQSSYNSAGYMTLRFLIDLTGGFVDVKHP